MEQAMALQAPSRVFIQLEIGDEPALISRVSVNPDSDIIDLQDAVKLKMSNKLAYCDAADLRVFHEGVALDIVAPIPLNSTRQNPLIIKAPERHQAGKYSSLKSVKVTLFDFCFVRPPLLSVDSSHLKPYLIPKFIS
jgi:hypothetical protein